ncbi:MAG TPA: TIGR02678 family protein [Pseudonocardiaceae bacterium]|nr:TIGR02678 family protein [Pseudonocardiaceae bacterium]
MSPRSEVLDGLSEIDAANVVRCARVLLRRPLLRAAGPDGDLLPLVYRHRMALADLFAHTLGYRLVVQRQFARLYKSMPAGDLPRGESTLSPRGYTYLALTIAALTGVGRQVLLSRLVADVRSAGVEAGITITDDLADRRAIAAALRHLLTLGVLHETEGSVAGLLGETTSEALITIDTDLLGQLLVGPLAEAKDGAELIELAARPGPRGTEHAVRRRLVEDPVVLYADLPPEQADWLRRRARRESGLLESCFGLITETRAEGIAITDPEDYLTDLVFPGASTVSRLALLALPELLADAETGARPDGRVPIEPEALRAVCARLVEDYPAAWSKQATEDLTDLTRAVLDLLGAMGLAVLTAENGWLLSPAAHRWLPEPDERPARELPQPEPEPQPEPGWSLFDHDDGAAGCVDNGSAENETDANLEAGA